MMDCKLWIFLGGLLICSAQERKCDLPDVENGKIAQYFYIFKKFYFPMNEGKKLSISCTAGYTSQLGKQEEQITCTAVGWTPPPICFKKCIKPLIENGTIQNPKESYKILEKFQYGCSNGYVTTRGYKTEEAECSSSGWEPPPMCHQISDRCEAPPLDYGHYSSEQSIFKLKQRLQYECDDGHRTTSGGSVDFVECLPRGWSSIPQCTKLVCEQLEPVENGGFYPTKETYVDRDVVQFFCKESYSLRGSELIQCYSFGWYPEPPTCEDRRHKCPPPPRSGHAIPQTERTEHRTGAAVHYECDHNYMMIGSEEIYCEDGHWTAPPSCVELKEKIICDQPPPTENGEVITKSVIFHSGDRVQYNCAEGFVLEGSGEITCKHGRWPDPPKCKAKTEYCPTPPDISNGELIETPSSVYQIGTSVEYRCKNYYLMEGSKTVNCTRGGWTELPTCLEPCKVTIAQMRDRKLELSGTFDIRSYLLHGDMVEFACSEGYDAPRHSELKGRCERGEIQYPNCSKRETVKGCGPPPVVRHANVRPSKEVYESGSSVVYQCTDYHFLNGTVNVRCTNGKWDTPPYCIEPCVLSQDEMDRNHLRLKWEYDNNYLFHGEFIEFICKEGYENDQTRILFAVRAKCSYGQLRYPECVKMK
ncbi:coagulation factor XIII B chain-like [Discoglossus pictus]